MTYAKTELGKTALQNRALGLTPRQRSLFIMFDGKRSLEEALKLTQALGVSDDDLRRLIELGLLAPTTSAFMSTPTSTATATTTDAIAPAMPADSTPAAPAYSTAAGSAGLPAPEGSSTLNPDASQYARAYPIAVRLTSGLGLRGFRLNLAVESSADLEALKDLAPKIKEAVGLEKFKELENALYR